MDKQLRAVALKYDPDKEDDIPQVVSKGEGELAKQIIDLAREHGILVRQDKELVEFLVKLEIDERIPPHLYELVSELLAFVYKIDEDNSVTLRNPSEKADQFLQ